MFIASDLTLPMEVWVAVAGAVLGGFAWMGKALLNVIREQREAYQEWIKDQRDLIERAIAALVENSGSLTSLSERMVDLARAVKEAKDAE